MIPRSVQATVMSLQQPTYRPDIDGLRAIAILSVLGYHAFPEAFPGGYVGVDVFFVISGFLITGLILSNLERNRFSLADFYLRRIRRIFPALILVMLVCLAVGWGILFTDEFRQLGKHVAGGAGFVSNLVLWNEVDYFDNLAETKPLLHLWSLAIEEQFYIVWPLLLGFGWKRRWNLLVLAMAIAAASFVTGVALIGSDATAAFYSPLSRAWEIMLGCCLACLSKGRSHTDQRLGNGLATLGVILLATGLATLDRLSAFPGWWALLPTLGTLLVIAAGPRAWINRHLLANRGMVGIGLISYPLYLWHWPLLSYANIVTGGPPAVSVRLAIMAASVALAWATYRCVELPIRNTPALHPRLFRGCVALMAGLLFCGAMVTTRGWPEVRLADAGRIISQARADWDFPTGEPVVVEGQRNGGKVLFLGDSYIQQLYPRIRHLAAQPDGLPGSVQFLTDGGCAPLPGVERRSAPACGELARQGYLLARSDEVKSVVIGGSWLGVLGRGDYYRSGDPRRALLDLRDEATLDEVLGALETELAALGAAGKNVYLVLNPPGGAAADPGFAADLRLSGASRLPVKAVPLAEHRQRVGFINDRLRRVAAEAGVTSIDPANWVCDARRCVFTDQAGIPYFKDATHFRASFVRESVTDFDPIVLETPETGNPPAWSEMPGGQPALKANAERRG